MMEAFPCRRYSEGPMKGIMGYTEDAVVSTDFIGDKRYLHKKPAN